MKLSLSDFPKCADSFYLPNGSGLRLTITTESDSDHGAPWKECDGHGPVSEWTTREKRPGERVLASDRHAKLFYDFAGAVEVAKRDGWDAPPYKTGTKDEQAVRAVEHDFEFLREYCAGMWEYIGVIVTLSDEDGNELGQESLWGVESRGDYWREVALELAQTLVDAQKKETSERSHWEARDTATIAKGGAS